MLIFNKIINFFVIVGLVFYAITYFYNIEQKTVFLDNIEPLQSNILL